MSKTRCPECKKFTLEHGFGKNAKLECVSPECDYPDSGHKA